MQLSRRSLFKGAAVAAVGLALPQTGLITDAEEVARRYWALDHTHLSTATSFMPVHEAWWRVGEVIDENAYMTTLQIDPAAIAPDTLRVGDTIQLGDLGVNGIYHEGLERQAYQVRYVDRANGIVTVTTPVRYAELTPAGHDAYDKLFR